MFIHLGWKFLLISISASCLECCVSIIMEYKGMLCRFFFVTAWKFVFLKSFFKRADPFA